MTKLYSRMSSLGQWQCRLSIGQDLVPGVNDKWKWPLPSLKCTFFIPRGHFTLKQFPLARAVLRCSCIRGVAKSRGVGDGTSWRTRDVLGKLSRAPIGKLEHPPDAKPSPHRQKDRPRRVPTRSCTHGLNSAQRKLLAKGDGLTWEWRH